MQKRVKIKKGALCHILLSSTECRYKQPPICDTIRLNYNLDKREGKNDKFSLLSA